ncbi:hypothetical protein LTR56_011382 [Elasticomyces elasticus]|nr:hypothetical protein LTR56_011382 [Elasticomyces elasticus]KAK3660984.1 hypothetical protein LTR22_007812 [Elasticomyces elasticus]KAK4932391.1 hypothetical protein LTR49_001260 [Elasticomyces elasticus]KAK5768399.1 hypothetical protein LTS12_001538 [Elasticomyces elasticus]
MSRIRAYFFAGATFFLHFTNALIITSPTAGENVSLAQPFVITWNEEAGDAAAVSIDLLNATALNPSPILENIAHNLNTSSGKVNVIDSGELEGDTQDYLRYELPSTPPPPVELADNEVAAAEMPSPDLNDEKVPTARIGDWHLRQPIPQRAESIRSGRTSDVLSVRSGSTTFGGRELSFAEALHDIVSQELRRNG